MDERLIQFRIGVMVLATVIITASLVIMFGGRKPVLDWLETKQVLYILVEDAPGVTPDTPVLKSGIRIGKVTNVQLADEVDGEMNIPEDIGAVITVEIDKDRRIYEDEICRISLSILGDAKLEFVREQTKSEPDDQQQPSLELRMKPPVGGVQEETEPEDQPRKQVKPHAKLRGVVATDPIQLVSNLEEDLVKAVASVAGTSDEIRQFVEKLNRFIGTDEEFESTRTQFTEIVDKTLATVDKISQVADNLNDVIGDEQVKTDLKDTVAQMHDAFGKVDGVLDQMSGTLVGVDGTVARLNTNLDNIQEFTKPLGERGKVVIERLEQGVEKLDLLMGELHTFGQSLNSDQGTLGQLVHNPELYDNLNQAVGNIEDLTVQLRPIVRDARVFSDKIARHPGILFSDAIRPGVGTKGIPSFSDLRGPTSSDQRASPRLWQSHDSSQSTMRR